jgi:hypothetical protein
MTIPGADPADAAEQSLPAGPDAPLDEPEVGLERTEADALEQAQPTAPEPHVAPRELPLEADAADAAEQAEAVPLDEDEDRS